MYDFSHLSEKNGPLTTLNRWTPEEHVKYFKFLGILFDETVTWKCHINMVTNKLSKVIGILN